jgi:hypothetical protein
MYSPSPTVRSSVIPLYMRGLGQDDPTMYDPGGDLIPPSSSSGSGDIGPLLPSIGPVTPIDTTMYDPSTGLVAPVSTLTQQDQALAQLYQSSVAAGTMTPAQAASAIAQLSAGAAAVAKAATGVSPSVAPKVALPAVATSPSILTSQTLLPGSGIPDIAIIGGVGILLVAMMGKK